MCLVDGITSENKEIAIASITCTAYILHEEDVLLCMRMNDVLIYAFCSSVLDSSRLEMLSMPFVVGCFLTHPLFLLFCYCFIEMDLEITTTTTTLR